MAWNVVHKKQERKRKNYPNKKEVFSKREKKFLENFCGKRYMRDLRRYYSPARITRNPQVNTKSI